MDRERATPSMYENHAAMVLVLCILWESAHSPRTAYCETMELTSPGQQFLQAEMLQHSLENDLGAGQPQPAQQSLKVTQHISI